MPLITLDFKAAAVSFRCSAKRSIQHSPGSTPGGWLHRYDWTDDFRYWTGETLDVSTVRWRHDRSPIPGSIISGVPCKAVRAKIKFRVDGDADFYSDFKTDSCVLAYVSCVSLIKQFCRRSCRSSFKSLQSRETFDGEHPSLLSIISATESPMRSA
jgi:hypothetical protein